MFEIWAYRKQVTPLITLLRKELPPKGKAKKILLFIGEGVAVPDGVDFAGIVRVQVFAV